MLSSRPQHSVPVKIGLAPQVSAEGRSLLRTRLAAASVVLLIGSSLFLLREIALVLFSDHFASFETVPYLANLMLLVLACLVCGGALILLKSNAALSQNQLRIVEVSIFGIVAADVGFAQYLEVQRQVLAGDGGLAVASIRGFMFIYFLLMVVYGLFIPNDWKQAARTVLPLALAPAFVNGLLWFFEPRFWEVCGYTSSIEQFSVSVILMVLSAVTVIYGAHVIYELRRKADEAREMGQYVLTERIGHGGMGEVWKAEHRMLARPAAVKLIKPEMLGPEAELTPSLVARFEREARATALLKSPHTVDVHDFGVTVDGILYYVMEMLEGLDLETMIERYGPMSGGRVIFLLVQVCESLAEAHYAGLVHRDLKPANLFVCRCGLVYDFVKVLDFGLVKQIDQAEGTRLTSAGVVTGTPAFLAPELAKDSRRADARSDIYSLGCVAYWMITGLNVFKSDSALGTIIEHIQTPPVRPSERVELEIAEDLEELILQCLEKDPDRRPQSVLELRDQLIQCRDSGTWGEKQASQWWNTNLPLELVDR